MINVHPTFQACRHHPLPLETKFTSQDRRFESRPFPVVGVLVIIHCSLRRYSNSKSLARLSFYYYSFIVHCCYDHRYRLYVVHLSDQFYYSTCRPISGPGYRIMSQQRCPSGSRAFHGFMLLKEVCFALHYYSCLSSISVLASRFRNRR